MMKNATAQERPKSDWQEKCGFAADGSDKYKPEKKVKKGKKQKQLQTPQQSGEDPTIPPLEWRPSPEGVETNEREPPTRGSEGVAPPSPSREGAPPEGAQPRAPQPTVNGSRRSKRDKKPRERLIEAQCAELEDQDVPFEIFSLEAI